MVAVLLARYPQYTWHKNTWIEDGTSDLVDKISLRINRFTGLQTTKIYDDFKEGKKDEYESLQVHGSNMF